MKLGFGVVFLIEINFGESKVGVIVVGFKIDSPEVIFDGGITIFNGVIKLSKEEVGFGVSRSKGGGFEERSGDLGKVFGIQRGKIVVNLGTFFPEIGISWRNR